MRKCRLTGTLCFIYIVGVVSCEMTGGKRPGGLCVKYRLIVGYW